MNATRQPSLNTSNQRWWVLFAVGTGTFMTALDTSVVNTILPVIRTDFGSEIATVEWVVTIYLLVLSGLLLSFGRLGDLHGHKTTYLTGFAIFVSSSLLCALSVGVHWLVFFRAVQALGAAMLAANSPAILTKNFPASQRGQALGIQATMTYLGLTAGPAFGGWLANQFGWRAVFLINLPVGSAALALSAFTIPRDQPNNKDERFDLGGAVVFLVALVALLLGLNQGYAWGWSSFPILGLLATSAVLFAGFLALERRGKAPMLDLDLFRVPVFSLATASAVLNYICVFSIIFLLPFYLIQGRGFDSAQAGLLLTAQPLVMAIVAPLSGTLSDRVGTRLPSATGMLILALGLFLVSRLSSQTPLSSVALALAVVGLGTGVFISPNNSALMGSAPRHRQGIAAGILATARNFGMVLGVGLSGAIFTTILHHGQASQAGEALFTAFQMSFFVLVFVALAGAVTSAARM